MTRVLVWAGVVRGALLVLMVLSAGRAEAQDEETPDHVDLSRTPISGSTRLIGLGGAFVALGSASEGVATNLAALGVRRLYSVAPLDADVSLDAAIGSWLPGTRFIDTESDAERQRAVVFGSLGVALQWHMAGVGFAASARRQALQNSSQQAAGFDPASFSGNFGVVDAGVAYGFADGQTVVGVGPRVVGFSFEGSPSGRSLSVAGVGGSVGVIYRPHYTPLRFGISLESAVNTRGERQPSQTDSEIWVPGAISMPWQVATGMAFQFGPRPMNLPPAASVGEDQKTPDQSRSAQQAALAHYRRLPRRYWLLSTELLIIGPGVQSGTSALLGQSAGAASVAAPGVSLSPRVGVETEVVPMWLTLRAGSYLEPSPVRDRASRVHGTFGFDVKMFHWDVFGLLGPFDGWMLSAAADAADRYVNTSFSLGLWH